MRSASAAEASRQQEHHDRQREQREARLDWRVAADLLDEQHEEEGRDAESGVRA